MSTPDDRIEKYLRSLRARLRTTPQDAERITAEAEDHLREAVTAALAAGLSYADAEDVAIASFGSVRAVARAHAASHGKAAVLASYVMAVWKLAWLLLLAAGGVGAVALIFDLTAGRPFVGAPAPGTRFAASQCRYWMHVNPGARTCAQASMLERSADVVTTGAFCAVVGAALLICYSLVPVIRRRRGRVIRSLAPRAFFPALALTVFGGLGLCCAVAAVITAERGGGPGMWLSGTIVCAVVAGACTLRLLRINRPRPPALARRHRPKPARSKLARLSPFRSMSTRAAVMVHGAHPGWPPASVRALRRRRRRYAFSAHHHRALRVFWLPMTISLPGGRHLQRRRRMFWRVRLPLWVVLAVAGWLVLGLWGIPLGLAAAIVAEVVFSYRPPHGSRRRRDPGDLAGVREPRRPRPTGGAGAVELPVGPPPWSD
jgi:hypothetical protein